ncbi:unnamed protein product [Cuscuta campestris]|uniref:Kinesin-like protein KIF22 n=1 Tax=Cuscuta campestris TaxID=132261 RepID=A0A484K7Z7_9ASTE|nr:unnamed protein product [Cuscuta campestris]
MASSAVDLNRLKPSQGPRKVRIVGKIRGFTDQELGFLGGSKPWITVKKPPEADSSGPVTILFGEKGTSRKDTFELDYCYEQGEDDSVLFSREIKPAISDIFTGKDASVIAYGARCSGKTHTIQNLATSAIRDILSRVEDVGKRVSISLFEVIQEHAYDILDPEKREVQVFEDSQGKVKLKGLSKVLISSISEFQDIYSASSTSGKQAQKTSIGQLRSHRGLVVHISSPDESHKDKPIGAINFIDLAGYEDSRSSIRDGTSLAESTRINKSLLSIMNVVFALNTNDSHVPYRENKLTRMLKESLGGNNFMLLLACMNPIFCQDTIYTVSLASRLCENIKMSSRSSAPKCRSSTKQDVRPLTTTPSSVKMQNSSGVRDFSIKRGPSALKGRKLFSGGKASTFKKVEVLSDISLASKTKLLQETTFAKESCVHKEEEVSPNDSMAIKSEFLQDDTLSLSKTKLLQETTSAKESCLHKEEEVSPNDSMAIKSEFLQDDTLSPSMQFSLHEDVSSGTFQAADSVSMISTFQCEEEYPHDVGVTSSTSSKNIGFTTGQGGDIEKENRIANTNKDGSPLLSERLRALTDQLKQLQASTPLAMTKLPEEGNQGVLLESMEPKTPVFENDFGGVMTKYNSPWEALSEHKSRAKDSFARECVKFLNSASKDDLKRLKGIGEKRAANILELREDSPEHFKSLEDLKEIGLSEKQVKIMVKTMGAELFA